MLCHLEKLFNQSLLIVVLNDRFDLEYDVHLQPVTIYNYLENLFSCNKLITNCQVHLSSFALNVLSTLMSQ